METTRVEVRVQPRAGRNEIRVDAASRIKVYVTAPPEGGKANEAALSLLVGRLGVAKGRIRIVRGHRTRDKILVVDGMRAEAVFANLRPSPNDVLQQRADDEIQ